MSPKDEFERIAKNMCDKYDVCSKGNMMRSPAIKWGKSVIAFYHNETMTFKFGSETEYFKHKYPGSDYLSPFKNKPPMKSWLGIPDTYLDDWAGLMQKCVQINNA